LGRRRRFGQKIKGGREFDRKPEVEKEKILEEFRIRPVLRNETGGKTL